MAKVKIKTGSSVSLGLGLLLLISLLVNFLLYQKYEGIKKETGTFKVMEVFDGDSFVIEGNQSVRLAGLSAPELEFCLGKEAKERLTDLIFGKHVKLSAHTKSKYERLLALVYQGDTLVNEVMLKEGLARYDSSGTEKDDVLLKASDEAKEVKVGIHSQLCTQTIAPNNRCVIKGNVDKHDLKNKIYHFPGCSGYEQVIVEKDRGEDWFCSEKEAEKQGFIKSETCYGRNY